MRVMSARRHVALGRAFIPVLCKENQLRKGKSSTLGYRLLLAVVVSGASRLSSDRLPVSSDSAIIGRHARRPYSPAPQSATIEMAKFDPGLAEAIFNGVAALIDTDQLS